MTLLTGGSPSIPTGITPEMLEPVVDAIVTNIGVIMPIGITIFGIVLGISLVPRLFRLFTRA